MSWPPGYIHDDDDGGHNCNVGDAARHPGCCHFLNEFPKPLREARIGPFHLTTTVSANKCTKRKNF